MLNPAIRLLLLIVVCASVLAGGVLVGREQSGGAEIALTSSDGRLNRARTYLVDIRASLAYALPLRLGASTFLDWVTDRRFLIRQAGNQPRYLAFEIGHGAFTLRLPQDCREGSLRGRGDWLSCAARQGGGLLVFSLPCALGACEGEARRYVPSALIAEHVWSPDGSRIAFVDIAVRTAGLALLDLRDEAVDRVADSVTGVSAKVSWSPDGQRIAYYTAEGMLLSLRVFDIATSETTLSLPLAGAALDEPPSWSPDGEQIALFQYDNFGADIFTVDLEGRSVHWLTEGKGASAYPRWSPNGEMLAYYVNSGGQMRLFLATSEGDNARALADLRVNDLSFAWRPCVAAGC